MTQTARITGNFMTVPFMVDEDIVAAEMIVHFAPWQPPSLSAVKGEYKKNQEPVLVIANEMPISLYTFFGKVKKEDVEQLHIQKFSTDFCMATGQRPFRKVVAGNNPPDFVAESNSGENVRVDCAQFALQSRRTLHGLFERIRQKIYSCDPSEFDHLRGLLVYICVQDLALPLRQEHEDNLVKALSSFRFHTDMGLTSGLVPPIQAPDIGQKETDVGWIFHASPFMLSSPASPFFSRMGFELAFVRPTEHSLSDVQDELNRLVIKHDKKEIDELLITVGSPDKNGYMYPSEKVVFDFIIQNGGLLAPKVKNLKQVYIHEWSTGQILNLYPEIGVVNPGIFTTMLPPHQPIAPRQ